MFEDKGVSQYDFWILGHDLTTILKGVDTSVFEKMRPFFFFPHGMNFLGMIWSDPCGNIRLEKLPGEA